MRGTRRAAAALLLLVLLSAGCGSDSRRDSEEVACRVAAFHEARARIIVRHYENGDLGTRGSIERSLEGPTFFDANGRIVAYDRMTSAQRRTFNRWAETNAVVDVIGPEYDRVLDELEPDC